jgi:WD40 repeat protein
MVISWDAFSLKAKSMLPHAVMARVAHLMPNGQVILIPANATNQVQIWNMAKKPKLVTALRTRIALYDVTAFSYRAKIQVATSAIDVSGGSVQLWSLNSKKLQLTGQASAGNTVPGDLTVSPDSHYIYCGVEGSTVIRWRIH